MQLVWNMTAAGFPPSWHLTFPHYLPLRATTCTQCQMECWHCHEYILYIFFLFFVMPHLQCGGLQFHAQEMGPLFNFKADSWKELQNIWPFPCTCRLSWKYSFNMAVNWTKMLYFYQVVNVLLRIVSQVISKCLNFPQKIELQGNLEDALWGILTLSSCLSCHGHCLADTVCKLLIENSFSSLNFTSLTFRLTSTTQIGMIELQGNLEDALLGILTLSSCLS